MIAFASCEMVASGPRPADRGVREQKSASTSAEHARGLRVHFLNNNARDRTVREREEETMGLGTIIIIILILALLGGFSGLGGGPFYGTGYYGGGGLGLVLVIVIILVLLGRI
jgi:hypothetical protein